MKLCPQSLKLPGFSLSIRGTVLELCLPEMRAIWGLRLHGLKRAEHEVKYHVREMDRKESHPGLHPRLSLLHWVYLVRYKIDRLFLPRPIGFLITAEFSRPNSSEIGSRKSAEGVRRDFRSLSRTSEKKENSDGDKSFLWPGESILNFQWGISGHPIPKLVHFLYTLSTLKIQRIQ